MPRQNKIKYNSIKTWKQVRPNEKLINCPTDDPLIKLVGAAGNPLAVAKGLKEVINTGGAVWGAVSKELLPRKIQFSTTAELAYLTFIRSEVVFAWKEEF